MGVDCLYDLYQRLRRIILAMIASSSPEAKWKMSILSLVWFFSTHNANLSKDGACFKDSLVLLQSMSELLFEDPKLFESAIDCFMTGCHIFLQLFDKL